MSVLENVKDQLKPDRGTTVVCHYDESLAAVMCFVDGADIRFPHRRLNNSTSSLRDEQRLFASRRAESSLDLRIRFAV